MNRPVGLRADAIAALDRRRCRTSRASRPCRRPSPPPGRCCASSISRLKWQGAARSCPVGTDPPPGGASRGASRQSRLAFVPSKPTQVGLEPRHSPHSRGLRQRPGKALALQRRLISRQRCDAAAKAGSAAPARCAEFRHSEWCQPPRATEMKRSRSSWCDLHGHGIADLLKVGG